MNILYHFRVKGVGPERVHISGIAAAFENMGHAVSFVSPTDIDPLKTGDVAPPQGGFRSVLYFFADKMPQVFFEFMEIFYNLMAIRKLKNKIAQVKPELIYERYAFFCFAGIYLARKFGIPIVLEINEVGGFDRVRPQKLVTFSKKFERYIFSHATVIVTVSEFLKEQIIQRGGKSESILIIPNGIDPKLFGQEIDTTGSKEVPELGAPVTIGFVGYLVHWHRLDMLVNVFARINRKYPNTKLVLVGDGVLRSELETLASSLGIDSDFTITGRVDHSEVPHFISQFDIAVIPNTNEYRSPIKLFEYMAMGSVIVAPDRPPVLSVLEHAETGFIFTNGDADDLFCKIETVLNNLLDYRRVGDNARRTVFEKYTWDFHAFDILAFVDKTNSRVV